jgi:hypothetical protein
METEAVAESTHEDWQTIIEETQLARDEFNQGYAELKHSALAQTPTRSAYCQ